jgi:hypothetical protein
MMLRGELENETGNSRENLTHSRYEYNANRPAVRTQVGGGGAIVLWSKREK